MIERTEFILRRLINIIAGPSFGTPLLPSTGSRASGVADCSPRSELEGGGSEAGLGEDRLLEVVAVDFVFLGWLVGSSGRSSSSRCFRVDLLKISSRVALAFSDGLMTRLDMVMNLQCWIDKILSRLGCRGECCSVKRDYS